MRTVPKIEILFAPKAGDITPVARQFRSLLGQIKADAEKTLKELNGAFRTFGGSRPSQIVAGFDFAAIEKAYAKIDSLSKNQQKFALVGYRADVREFNRAEKEKQRAAEISAIAQIQRDKQIFIARENQRKRDFQEFVRLEKEKARAMQQASRQSPSSRSGQFGGDLFSTVFGASTLAGLTLNAISSILGGIKSGISAGFDQAVAAGVSAASFQQTKTAITGVLGSAIEADAAIAKLEKTALNTPGLTFRNALDGYQRLRAVQFGATEAERALVGLSKVKVLSGGTKEDLQAVLINFAQIRSVGKLTGDELRETLGRFPYFAQVLQKAFGTISTEKIGELQLSSEEFFNRIFDEMDKLPSVAGGASDAWEKLVDEFFKAQVAFGTPILDPAMESMQNLTAFLRENKGEWAVWGTFVGDIIRGANAAIKTLGETGNTNLGLLASPLGVLLSKSGADMGKVGSFAVNPILPVLSLLGERGRRKREIKEITAEEAVRKPLSLAADVFDFSRQKEAQDKEVRLYRETVKEIASQQQVRLSNSEIFYTRERALIADTLRANTGEELSYQLKLNQIERAESNKRLSIMQQGIERQKGLNEKLIKSYNPQDQNRIRGIKELEIAEKLASLQKEQAKTFLEEANRRQQILQLEKQIADQRRQSAIELKNLQIEQSQLGYDSQISDIQRLLGSTNEGFGKLIELTRNSYQETSRLSIESYQLQLQDLSLTKEKRLNLTTEMFLNEQKLAEENRRAIQKIEDEKFQNSLENFKRQNEQIIKLSQQRGRSFSQVQGSFLNDSISFGQGSFDVEPASAILQSFGQEPGKTILDNIQKVFSGSMSIYQARRDVLEKTHKIEITNLQREIDLNKDFIELERIKLKGQISSNIVTLSSNRASLLNQADKSTSEVAESLRKQAEGIDSAIENWQKILSQPEADLNAYFDRSSTTIKQLNNGIQETTQSVKELSLVQAGEKQDLFSGSAEGLKKLFGEIKSGQKDKIIQDIEERKFLIEKNSLLLENKALELKYYEDSEYRAELRKNRLLGFEREVFELREELANKANFSQAESDAKVLGYLNSQIKSVSESFADFRVGLAENYLGAITSPFDALEKKLEGLNPVVRGLAQTFLDLGRDIVKAFSQKMIMQLLGLGDKSGGSSNSSGGGFLSNLFSGIKSLFNRGSSSNRSFGGSSSGGGLNDIFTLGGLNNADGTPFDMTKATNGATGSKFSFANGLALGGVGLSLLGGLFGGRVGGTLSGAGTGIGIGMALGSVIPGLGTVVGGLIGGAVGGIAGLFGSIFGKNSLRKKEEKSRTQFINDALGGLSGLDKILADSTALKYEPPSQAITEAEALVKQIKEQYLSAANSLTDKKTRNIAIRDASRIDLAANPKLDAIRQAVRNAQEYGATDKSLVSVFAGGGFITQFNEFKRRNGFLSGDYSRGDVIPAMLSGGEMVLNPMQQQQVRRAAGFDAFKHADIPNYASGVYLPPAAAPSVNISRQPINITIVVEGEVDAARIKNILTDNLSDADVSVQVAKSNAKGISYGALNK